MNADLQSLSTAVRRVTTNSKIASSGATSSPTTAGDIKLKRDAPVSRRSRRQSSKGSTSSTALQFLEAAHRSWSSAQEDLPFGSSALERRKSNRSRLNDVGHKSWTFGEKPKAIPEDESIGSASVLKKGNSKMMPSSGKTPRELPASMKLQEAMPSRSNSHPRRASIGGGSSICLLYTSPSPRDQRGSRMPSSA